MKFFKNEQLSTKELIGRLGVSEGTWKKRRKDILFELANLYKYEVIYSGQARYYHFLEDGEFEYHHKRKVKDLSANGIERDKAFESAIIETLTDQPLNTAANVKRIIIEEWPEVTKLGYAESTTYEYTRVRMRKWFGKDEDDNGSFENMEDLKMRKGYIKRKVWCRLDINNNVYIPLPKEEIDDFIYMLRINLMEDEDDEIKLLADFDAGTITKEEYDEESRALKYGSYVSAKESFKDKYGYFPIKVPEYIVYR